VDLILVLTLYGETFLSLQGTQYNTDSSVALLENKLNIFKNQLAYIPCSTGLLQNLLFPQPVKDIPALHGTRKFITVFKTTNHLCRT
jgi:hypothetical protein